MAREFNEILDECIDRLNRGERLESCLVDYPEQADQLKPVLETTTRIKSSLVFTPSDEAFRKGRQRLYDALEKKHRPSIWERIVGRRAVWVTAAAIIAVVLIAYFGLMTLGLPESPSGGQIAQTPPPSSPAFTPPPTPGASSEPTRQYIAAANPRGNFVFLVSDEVNAIADFSSLNLVVERIGILQSGDSGQWLEFSPLVKEFDLSILPGDKTLELWRGDVPAGQFSKTFIQVGSVTGVLKETGETLDIKLPSNKLQMSLPFEVEADVVTSFTYDLTVVKAGNDKDKGKYILKPQIGESGASHSQD